MNECIWWSQINHTCIAREKTTWPKKLIMIITNITIKISKWQNQYMTKTHHKTQGKSVFLSNQIHHIKQDGIAFQATRLNPSPNS